MAEKHACTPDDVKHVLYERPHSPRGYKKEYLSQNLTEMEEQFIICASCEGIMRDASTNEGEITCDLCCNKRFDAKPVKQVRSLVAKLGIKCPLLRDCEWIGQLSEAEEHFGICGSTLVSCPLGCESVVKRRETDQHTGNECQLRKVNCNFCGSTFQSVVLMDHVEICPDQPINCDCGIEIPRSKMDMHIETECPFGEVECPYAKYSCKIGNMPRKDLLAHKKEFYIEHQDMLEEENKRTKEENEGMQERYKKLENRTKHLEQENHELKRAIQTKREIDGLDLKINFNTREPKLEANEFKIAYNEFKCILSSVDPIRISIKRSIFRAATYGSLPLSECRLFMDPTNRLQEEYFEVFRFNLKFAGGTKECVLTLDKSIYSSYIQEDGTLIMRLYFF